MNFAAFVLVSLVWPKIWKYPKNHILLVSLVWSVLLFTFLLLKGKKMSIYNVSSFSRSLSTKEQSRNSVIRITQEN